MNWKKITSIFLGSLLGVWVGKTEVRAEEISGKITVWEHAITFEAAMETLIKGFEEQYPNVEVEWEIWDLENYYDLVSIGIQAGDGPDLFYTDGIARTKMREYVEKGMLMDLTDKVDFQYFDEKALWRQMIDERCYGVPWLTFDSRVVYYNIDMFEEHGWQIPADFAEFEQLLQKMKEAGIVPISLASQSSYSLLFLWETILTAMYPEYVAGLNNETVDLVDQPVQDAMQKMLDWAEKGYFGENWLEVVDGNDQGLRFTTGKAAMNVCGSWDGVNMQFNNPELNMGVFILPSIDGEKRLIGGMASGFSVNADSDNLEAALAFANYCASLDGQTRWVQANGGISASEYIESSTENSKMITEQAQGNLFTSWQLVLASMSDEAITVWERGFVELFTGELTIDEFVEEIRMAIE